MTQSEQIFKWLEDNRNFFKSDGICKALKIDKGNFSKYKAAKSIPEKYIPQIIVILIIYGFREEEKEISFGGLKFPTKIFENLGNKVVFVSPKKDSYDGAKNSHIENDEMGQWVEPKLSTAKIKRIEAIGAEKMPDHIKTLIGRKSWEFDKKKRIAAIENEK